MAKAIPHVLEIPNIIPVIVDGLDFGFSRPFPTIVA
jgi:hypothetical protein